MCINIRLYIYIYIRLLKKKKKKKKNPFQVLPRTIKCPQNPSHPFLVSQQPYGGGQQLPSLRSNMSAGSWADAIIWLWVKTKWIPYDTLFGMRRAPYCTLFERLFRCSLGYRGLDPLPHLSYRAAQSTALDFLGFPSDCLLNQVYKVYLCRNSMVWAFPRLLHSTDVSVCTTGKRGDAGAISGSRSFASQQTVRLKVNPLKPLCGSKYEPKSTGWKGLVAELASHTKKCKSSSKNPWRSETSRLLTEQWSNETNQKNALICL